MPRGGINIRFLYWEGCPSHGEALERLRQAIDEEGIHAKVEVLEVETDEQAEKLRFIGSPTIHINGQDIDPASTPRYALTCRSYRLEDGRISPLPSLTMIRSALRRAKEKQS